MPYCCARPNGVNGVRGPTVIVPCVAHFEVPGAGGFAAAAPVGSSEGDTGVGSTTTSRGVATGGASWSRPATDEATPAIGAGTDTGLGDATYVRPRRSR